MFGFLQIVIGIVFVILLFSILSSTLLEFFAALLSMRGRKLFRAINTMIGGQELLSFFDHPYFKQLAHGSSESLSLSKNGRPRRLPSYINAATFSAILTDLYEINSQADLEAKIQQVPNENLRKLLVFFYNQCGGDFVLFKQKIETWFNEVMDRASGAYKRNSHKWLFGIGLAVAIVFNADVLQVYHNLSVNTTLRDAIAKSAEAYVNNNAAPVAPNLNNPDIDATGAEIKRIIDNNIGALESPLGLGWDQVQWDTINFGWVLYKLMGWLTMAVAISFGATFWFDLLKRLVNLRSTGPATNTASDSKPADSGSTPAATPVGGGSIFTQPPSGMFESVRAAPAPAAPIAPAPRPIDAPPPTEDDNTPKG